MMAESTKKKLGVSICSDAINDQMTVEIMNNDIPLIIGVIKDEKTVLFRPSKEQKFYKFEDVKLAMLDFIRKMEETENL